MAFCAYYSIPYDEDRLLRQYPDPDYLLVLDKVVRRSKAIYEEVNS